jgi:hypothetical protein
VAFFFSLFIVACRASYQWLNALERHHHMVAFYARFDDAKPDGASISRVHRVRVRSWLEQDVSQFCQ